jgi:hypothetical protein
MIQAFLNEVNESTDLSQLGEIPPESIVLQMSNAAEAVYDAAVNSYNAGYEAVTD